MKVLFSVLLCSVLLSSTFAQDSAEEVDFTKLKIERLKRLQKKIEDLTISKTNISRKKLREVLKNKVDWYMTAKEAVDLGVIDGVI